VAVAGWPECVTSLAYTPGLMDNGLLFILPLFLSYCILLFISRDSEGDVVCGHMTTLNKWIDVSTMTVVVHRKYLYWQLVTCVSFPRPHLRKSEPRTSKIPKPPLLPEPLAKTRYPIQTQQKRNHELHPLLNPPLTARTTNPRLPLHPNNHPPLLNTNNLRNLHHNRPALRRRRARRNLQTGRRATLQHPSHTRVRPNPQQAHQSGGSARPELVSGRHGAEGLEFLQGQAGSGRDGGRGVPGLVVGGVGQGEGRSGGEGRGGG
jgi:hypothetical protein